MADLTQDQQQQQAGQPPDFGQAMDGPLGGVPAGALAGPELAALEAAWAAAGGAAPAAAAAEGALAALQGFGGAFMDGEPHGALPDPAQQAQQAQLLQSGLWGGAAGPAEVQPAADEGPSSEGAIELQEGSELQQPQQLPPQWEGQPLDAPLPNGLPQPELPLAQLLAPTGQLQPAEAEGAGAGLNGAQEGQEAAIAAAAAAVVAFEAAAALEAGAAAAAPVAAAPADAAADGLAGAAAAAAAAGQPDEWAAMEVDGGEGQGDGEGEAVVAAAADLLLGPGGGSGGRRGLVALSVPVLEELGEPGGGWAGGPGTWEA
jgi:hypothetical protein